MPAERPPPLSESDLVALIMADNAAAAGSSSSSTPWQAMPLQPSQVQTQWQTHDSEWAPPGPDPPRRIGRPPKDPYAAPRKAAAKPRKKAVGRRVDGGGGEDEGTNVDVVDMGGVFGGGVASLWGPNSDTARQRQARREELQMHKKPRKKRDPGELPPRMQLPFELTAVWDEAQRLFIDSKHSEAQRKCQDIVALQPAFPHAYQMLGMIFEEADELPRAYEHYFIEANLNTSRKDLLKRVSFMAYEIGENERGAFTVRKALAAKEYRHDIELLTLKAAFSVKMMRFGSFNTAFKAALRRVPRAVDIFADCGAACFDVRREDLGAHYYARYILNVVGAAALDHELAEAFDVDTCGRDVATLPGQQDLSLVDFPRLFHTTGACLDVILAGKKVHRVDEKRGAGVALLITTSVMSFLATIHERNSPQREGGGEGTFVPEVPVDLGVLFVLVYLQAAQNKLQLHQGVNYLALAMQMLRPILESFRAADKVAIAAFEAEREDRMEGDSDCDAVAEARSRMHSQRSAAEKRRADAGQRAQAQNAVTAKRKAKALRAAEAKDRAVAAAKAAAEVVRSQLEAQRKLDKAQAKLEKSRERADRRAQKQKLRYRLTKDFREACKAVLAPVEPLFEGLDASITESAQAAMLETMSSLRAQQVQQKVSLEEQCESQKLQLVSTQSQERAASGQNKKQLRSWLLAQQQSMVETLQGLVAQRAARWELALLECERVQVETKMEVGVDTVVAVEASSEAGDDAAAPRQKRKRQPRKRQLLDDGWESMDDFENKQKTPTKKRASTACPAPVASGPEQQLEAAEAFVEFTASLPVSSEWGTPHASQVQLGTVARLNPDMWSNSWPVHLRGLDAVVVEPLPVHPSTWYQVRFEGEEIIRKYRSSSLLILGGNKDVLRSFVKPQKVTRVAAPKKQALKAPKKKITTSVQVGVPVASPLKASHIAPPRATTQVFSDASSSSSSSGSDSESGSDSNAVIAAVPAGESCKAGAEGMDAELSSDEDEGFPGHAQPPLMMNPGPDDHRVLESAGIDDETFLNMEPDVLESKLRSHQRSFHSAVYEDTREEMRSAEVRVFLLRQRLRLAQAVQAQGMQTMGKRLLAEVLRCLPSVEMSLLTTRPVRFTSESPAADLPDPADSAAPGFYLEAARVCVCLGDHGNASVLLWKCLHIESCHPAALVGLLQLTKTDSGLSALFVPPAVGLAEIDRQRLHSAVQVLEEAVAKKQLRIFPQLQVEGSLFDPVFSLHVPSIVNHRLYRRYCSQRLKWHVTFLLCEFEESRRKTCAEGRQQVQPGREGGASGILATEDRRNVALSAKYSLWRLAPRPKPLNKSGPSIVDPDAPAAADVHGSDDEDESETCDDGAGNYDGCLDEKLKGQRYSAPARFGASYNTLTVGRIRLELQLLLEWAEQLHSLEGDALSYISIMAPVLEAWVPVPNIRGKKLPLKRSDLLDRTDTTVYMTELQACPAATSYIRKPWLNEPQNCLWRLVKSLLYFQPLDGFLDDCRLKYAARKVCWLLRRLPHPRGLFDAMGLELFRLCVPLFPDVAQYEAFVTGTLVSEGVADTFPADSVLWHEDRLCSSVVPGAGIGVIPADSMHSSSSSSSVGRLYVPPVVLPATTKPLPQVCSSADAPPPPKKTKKSEKPPAAPRDEACPFSSASESDLSDVDSSEEQEQEELVLKDVAVAVFGLGPDAARQHLDFRRARQGKRGDSHLKAVQDHLVYAPALKKEVDKKAVDRRGGRGDTTASSSEVPNDEQAPNDGNDGGLKVQCGCGKKFLKINFPRHCKTKRHMDFVARVERGDQDPSEPPPAPVPKALEEIWAEEAAPSIVPIVPFVPVPVPSISLVPPPASAAPAAPAVAPKKAELQGFELEFVSIARAVSAASGDAASDLLLAPSAGHHHAGNVLTREALLHAAQGADLILPVQGLHQRHPESVVACLLLGHHFLARGCYGEALQRYLDAYLLEPQQPLTSLCITNVLCFLAVGGLVPQRTETFVKALAFLARYVQSRLSGCGVECSPEQVDTLLRLTPAAAAAAGTASGGSGGLWDDVVAQLPAVAVAAGPELALLQEAFYNTGRTFQEVGLHALAERSYRATLGIADARADVFGAEGTQRLPGGGLTREAAHNLVKMYQRSNSADLALQVMRRYLTI